MNVTAGKNFHYLFAPVVEFVGAQTGHKQVDAFLAVAYFRETVFAPEFFVACLGLGEY